jgi:hypothetical protein
MEKPTYCEHCGNLTFKKQTGNYFTAPDENRAFTSYILYRCEICDGAVLEKATHQLPKDYSGSRQPRYYIAAAEVTTVEQLWPPPLSLSPEAPARVREIYEEARTVMRKSPSSFVVQIGPVLC